MGFGVGVRFLSYEGSKANGIAPLCLGGTNVVDGGADTVMERRLSDFPHYCAVAFVCSDATLYTCPLPNSDLVSPPPRSVAMATLDVPYFVSRPRQQKPRWALKASIFAGRRVMRACGTTRSLQIAL